MRYDAFGKTSFIDTFDLSDSLMKEQIFGTLEGIFREKGTYRIFFVVNLRKLRIFEEDLTSIKLVLNSIKDKTIKYNIIVNRITEAEEKLLTVEAQDKIKSYFSNSLGSSTSKLIWIKEDKDLVHQKIQYLEFSSKLSQIYNVEGHQTIDIEDIDERHRRDRVRKEYEDKIKAQQAQMGGMKF